MTLQSFYNRKASLFISIFKTILVVLFTLFLHTNAFCQRAINISATVPEMPVSYSYSFVDITNKNVNKSNVLSQTFATQNNRIPDYPMSANHVWQKFIIYNGTSNSNLFFDLRYTNLSAVTLYKLTSQQLVKIGESGNASINNTKFAVPDIIFPLNQQPNTQQTYLLEINSIHPIFVAAFICTKKALTKANTTELIINAAYAGVLFVMLVYNLFLFFSIKDKSYLVYVIYTFSLLLAQSTNSGYLFKYVWPAAPSINLYAVLCTTSFSFITGIWFMVTFLQVSKRAPIMYRILQVLILSFFILISLSLANLVKFSYYFLNCNVLISVVFTLIVCIHIARQGYRPAVIFFIAWSVLLAGLLIVFLRNFGIVPFNTFTYYILYIGSAIETTLLSIALADKINIFRKEKEVLQAESLRISKENEQLIQEQNVVLEQKINERTQALEQTLSNLKNAQMQLVESEKMASLGQLTAGIAHEINNPINFVKSNVKPLQLDVNDLFELIRRYQKLHGAPGCSELVMLNEIKLFEEKIDPGFIKDEIESLIDGIEEGAERTAEIVKSLRNFSRLDESEIKMANVHEGINSTLVLLKNIIPPNIKIIKQFAAEGDVECYPSKLNQAFMNIITNAIQAIKAKPYEDGESIVIATRDTEDFLQISIKDTGAGMTEEVKHKMFDPFFTTKEVGEGTGLGMSITFKIIEKHQGKISVVSSPGNGSEILLSIPYAQIPDPIIINNEYE